MFYNLKKQKLLPGNAFPPQEAPPLTLLERSVGTKDKPPSSRLVLGETKCGIRGKREGCDQAAGKEQDAARGSDGVGGDIGEVTVRVPRTGCVVLSIHEGVAGAK